MNVLSDLRLELLQHPPNMPDMEPEDFYLFPDLKITLGSVRFQDLNVQQFVNTCIKILLKNLKKIKSKTFLIKAAFLFSLFENLKYFPTIILLAAKFSLYKSSFKARYSRKLEGEKFV